MFSCLDVVDRFEVAGSGAICIYVRIYVRGNANLAKTTTQDKRLSKICPMRLCLLARRLQESQARRLPGPVLISARRAWARVRLRMRQGQCSAPQRQWLPVARPMPGGLRERRPLKGSRAWRTQTRVGALPI